MNVSLQSVTRLARPLITRFAISAPRTFTTFSPLRPTLSAPTAAIRPNMTSFLPTGVADVVPKTAISAHPALADMQVRCGPRNTMNGHTRLVQKRRSGFLARMRSKTGSKILKRRKMKGRKRLAW
ncbi:hypothetical protein B0I35DRAFT_478744 [Stachybotrys elegans]|uniref:Ribosomal protein L34 n=1 Tax=Stachybotrys elegans TaxID=80388 RepID=A0A8K0SS72_9HYPO|nr:hypothetical protein B0I35DRAFT_478744 [Stachybotrys elegans]